jgi:hypothetical protein
VLLVYLHTICAKQGLETWLSPNNEIRIYLLDMGHIWTKNAFWDVNNRKWRTWCKIVSPFLYNNTYGFPMLTMDTKCPKEVFYVGLVDLHNICSKQGLETWLTPNIGIRICLPDMEHRWTKYAFEKWITRNDVNGVRLFHFFINNTYGLRALTTYTKFPIQFFVQIKYLMCD